MPLSKRQKANKILRILRVRRDAAARRGDEEIKERHKENLRSRAAKRENSLMQASVPEPVKAAAISKI